MRRLIICEFSPQTTSRGGAIIVFAMLALLVVSMLGASLLRTVGMSQRQLQREQLRTQAVWLADSGCDRAIARLRREPTYVGESWAVAAEQLAADRTAIVTITVTADPQSDDRAIVSSVAEYPHNSPQAIRITRQMTIPRSTVNNP